MNSEDFTNAQKGGFVTKEGLFGPYVITYIDTSHEEAKNWFIVAECIVPKNSMLDNQSSMDRIYPAKDIKLYRQTVYLKLYNQDISQWRLEQSLEN